MPHTNYTDLYVALITAFFDCDSNAGISFFIMFIYNEMINTTIVIPHYTIHTVKRQLNPRIYVALPFVAIGKD